MNEILNKYGITKESLERKQLEFDLFKETEAFKNFTTLHYDNTPTGDGIIATIEKMNKESAYCYPATGEELKAIINKWINGKR